MQLGLLDLGIINNELDSSQVLSNTIKVAKEAEIIGFSRYWLAEHYRPYCAWGYPGSLVGVIASNTRRIKVGTAGIIFAGSNVFRIAQDFKLLEYFYPGRIDLGLAKGFIPNEFVNQLVGGNKHFLINLEVHNERINSLNSLLDDKASGISIQPKLSQKPEIWVLSSGNTASALFAADNGLSYSLSLFHTPKLPDPEIIQNFQERFQQKSNLKPKCNVAISVVCAQTDKKVNEILLTVPKDIIVSLAGTKNKILDEIQKIKTSYLVDEIIIADLSTAYIDRINTIDVLSEMFEQQD